MFPGNVNMSSLLFLISQIKHTKKASQTFVTASMDTVSQVTGKMLYYVIVLYITEKKHKHPINKQG